MEWTRGDYHLSDDKQRLDLTVICELLASSYWANDRPRAAMEVAIQHSLCLGLYHNGQQVGFARAVTDRATFTWVCDVIIHPDHRGNAGEGEDVGGRAARVQDRPPDALDRGEAEAQPLVPRLALDAEPDAALAGVIADEELERDPAQRRERDGDERAPLPTVADGEVRGDRAGGRPLPFVS